MTCPSCGEQVQPADHFCLNCGHPLRLADPTHNLTMPPTPTYGDTPPYYGDTPPSYADTAPNYGDTPPNYDDTPAYGGTVPSYDDTPAYAPRPAPPAYAEQPAPAYAPRPTQTQTRGGSGQWASGSSFPTANPYNSQPPTVTPGTMVNGRPVGGSGGGVLKGLGAAIVALGVILGKFGAALGSLGIFKFFFYIWALRLLFHGLGGVVMLIIVLLIVGAIWRSRTA